MKLKRAYFDRLNHFLCLNIRFKRLAERMRTSVHAASRARLLRSAFKLLFNAAACSKQCIKMLEQDEAVKSISTRHCLVKVFKRWSLLCKEIQLQSSQQVIARSVLIFYHFTLSASQLAIRIYLRRVQTPRILLRFFHRWNGTIRRGFQPSVTHENVQIEKQIQQQSSDLLVSSFDRMHAEAGDSSALGKLLFEKVIAALGEEVKATLQFV